jgi:enamine deaminase RidA (YjgF/YER057c/UK114 family)
MDRVVSVTCLIKDQADYAEINKEYVKHWSILPARHTTVGFAGGQGKCGFACVALLIEPTD